MNIKIDFSNYITDEDPFDTRDRARLICSRIADDIQGLAEQYVDGLKLKGKLPQAVTGKIERGEGEAIVGIPAFPVTDNQKHQAYLDYRNDFLTVTRFAEHYGWSEDLANKIIDEGRVIHNLANAEGTLNIIDRLKIERPEIAIVVKWEEDHDFEWDGDGEDPITDGYYPYNVDITASRIVNGELLEGTASLGGCYSKDGGKDDPEIGGYLNQLVDDAVAELDKQK